MSLIGPEEFVGFDKIEQTFHQLYFKKHLPKVLLFSGREGLGKSTLMMRLAAFLLCRENSLCGVCPSCKTEKEHHPELFCVASDAMEKALKVEVAHKIIDFLQYKAQGMYGNYRVVVISDCDRLNSNAANTLLKTLEEPPENCFLLLSTSRPHLLLDTILSRCVKWPLRPPPVAISQAFLEKKLSVDSQTIKAALQKVGYAPGAVIRQFEDQEYVNTVNFAEDQLDKLIATAISGNSNSAFDVKNLLDGAQKLSKIDKSLPSLLRMVELALNRYYKKTSSLNQVESNWNSIWMLRQALRRYRQYGEREQIALNKQLCFEGIGLAGLGVK